VTVKVRARGGATHLIAGTIFGRTQPRIVRVDDFRFEAIPEGPTFLIRNQDRPGVVGHVGTLLGDAGINIKRMQLGLHLSNGQAMQLLSVDPLPSSRVLEAVRALPGIEMALLLDLGREHRPCRTSFASAPSGAMRARARSSTSSPAARIWSCASRAGRTPATRWSSTARPRSCT
jgi:hypothetical protein